MSDRIYLDPEHGVNPGMMCCFICGEPKGVILHGVISSRKSCALRKAGIAVPPGGEAPRNLVIDKEPCDRCQGYMGQGVILISCREPKEKDDAENPYRTGGWCVVREDLIKRVIQPQELCDDILRKRVAFIPDDAWDMLGLPRGEQKEETSDDTTKSS